MSLYKMVIFNLNEYVKILKEINQTGQESIILIFWGASLQFNSSHLSSEIDQ